MRLIKILFFTSGIISSIPLLAKNKTNQDTVYYLVDTAKVSLNDRLISIEQEPPFNVFTLHCKCYPGRTDPVFTYPLASKAIMISKTGLKKIKLINIKDLINLASKYGEDRIERAQFYFIEPSKGHYIKHQVFLLDPKKKEIVY